MKKSCKIILNALKNEMESGYCTKNNFDKLKRKIINNSENNTEEWRNLIEKIQILYKDTYYIPLGGLIKILTQPFNPYLEPGKRFARDEIKREENTSWINNERHYTDNRPNSITKNKKRKEFIPETNYQQPAKAEKSSYSPPPPPTKKAVEKQQVFSYYFPFPDPTGFFWDDKKTNEQIPSSAYMLRIIGKNKNIGEYSLLTKKNKIIKNAIINQKAFLKPVCTIVEDKGSEQIIVEKNGLLEKKQNKWFPVSGKELKIKII